MPPSPLDALEVSPAQGTTGGKPLNVDQLLALRTMFLLLDAWDRNSRPGTPVDTQMESAQGERHACSVSARRQRTA
jgi:hypothetical protein